MTHRPDVEELVVHAVKDHGCDSVRAIVEVLQKESIVDATKLTLAAPVDRVVDLTDVMADKLFERIDEIHALHDAHHGSEMFQRVVEERRVSSG